jgi:hypothetical protein
MEEKELAAGNVIQHPEGSLRWNAQQLLMSGNLPAIQQIADRFDGKPAQEQTVNLNDTRNNQSEAELRDYLTAALLATRRAAPAPQDQPQPETRRSSIDAIGTRGDCRQDRSHAAGFPAQWRGDGGDGRARATGCESCRSIYACSVYECRLYRMSYLQGAS